jgi:hypothetical protein
MFRFHCLCPENAVPPDALLLLALLPFASAGNFRQSLQTISPYSNTNPLSLNLNFNLAYRLPAGKQGKQTHSPFMYSCIHVLNYSIIHLAHSLLTPTPSP